MVSDNDRSQPSSLPDVGSDVMGLLATSAAQLMQRRPELVLVLHQHLLELAPSLVRMPSSGRPMCDRLVQAVLHVAGAGTTTPPADAAVVVRRVAVENYREGFAEQECGAVTHAVFVAVRGVHAGPWTSVTSSAWTTLLLWFRNELLAAADVQPALPAPTATAATSRRQASHRRDGDAPSLPRSAVIDDDLDDDLDNEDEPGYASLMSSMTLDSRQDKRAR